MKKTIIWILTFTLSLSLIAGMSALSEEAPVTINVGEDFIVMHLDDKVTLDYQVENMPENARVRLSLSDGAVLHVNSAGEVIPFTNGLCDVGIEVYTPSSYYRDDAGWHVIPAETLAATEKPIKITVVPHKRENAGIKLGIQLYNFRNMTFTPEEGVDLMRYLASLGYDGVEWVGSYINTAEKTVFGWPYAEFKAIMDKLGLESAGRHGGGGLIGNSVTEVGQINEEAVLADVEFCEAMDCRLDWTSSSFPVMTGEPAPLDRYTPEEMEAIIDIVNQQVALYAPYYDKAGITQMYHNHAEMIQMADGSYALSKLNYANQVDYYWLVKGLGAIPSIGPEGSMAAGLEYIAGIADKVVSLHIKDGTIDIYNSRDYTSWGQGEFDIQGVIDIGRAHDNIQWAIVENDGADLVAGGPMQDARISAMYAQTLDFTRIGD